jgi:Spy/CpxP family protein refolding chaperone
MEANHTLFGGRTLAAIALSALISAAPALAQQTATTPSNGQSAQSSTSTTTTSPEKGEKHARRHHKKMAKELGLTADQKKQLKSLRQDQKKQIDAVRNDSSLSQEQKAAKLKEIHKAGMEKRDAVLTPEQREKMQHLRDENEANEGGEHPHRHGKSGMSTTPPAPEQAPQTAPTK